MAKTQKDAADLPFDDAEFKRFWRDLDEDQREFYRGLDPAVAICRGFRRHNFPRLIPGKPIPRQITITRPGGIYQMTVACAEACGRTITYTADRFGRPDYSTARYGGWEAGRQLATGLGLAAVDDREWASYIQAEAVTEGFKLQEAQRARAEAAREARSGKHGHAAPLPPWEQAKGKAAV
jgi:hypothetical protein